MEFLKKMLKYKINLEAGEMYISWVARGREREIVVI